MNSLPLLPDRIRKDNVGGDGEDAAPRWVHRRGAFDLTSPILMGVLNVTPDSFSDGGLHLDPSNAVARAAEMITEGAHLIDVGGESTRPGARPVDPEEAGTAWGDFEQAVAAGRDDTDSENKDKS